MPGRLAARRCIGSTAGILVEPMRDRRYQDEKLGYSGDHPHVADMERRLDGLGRLANLLVPTVVQLERYKWLEGNSGEEAAMKSIARTTRSKIADLDTSAALLAAELSRDHGLSVADAVIYASARKHHADLITSDDHVEGLAGVVYFSTIPFSDLKATWLRDRHRSRSGSLFADQDPKNASSPTKTTAVTYSLNPLSTKKTPSPNTPRNNDTSPKAR